MMRREAPDALADRAIAVEGLVKRYGDVEAVAGITFAVPRGTVFGLLGRNGAGKTTTLECCIGIGRPTSGSVRVLGLDPTDRRDLARLRPLIGVQLQATSLPEKANVGEVLELYAAYYGIAPRAAEMAERVGLDGKLDRQIAQMSGGEQQRLALALALQHDPEVLFLDEPTAGMDAFGRRILWGEVERLRDGGKTIVLTTHYIEEAERLSDRICMIQRGKIVAEAAPAELVARYGGDATVSIAAEGFAPDEALQGLGVWTRAGARWKLATRGEPGLALAAVVTHANTLGAKIASLDMHRPTLEDAFIAITGETIEETV
jgi:ABC-2 type transport system ATP-binding protein